MTCIVGIAQDGQVWLGGDSLSCREGLIQQDLMPKVFKRGEFLIGGCGDARLCDLMRYEFRLPKLAERENLDAFMVRKFAPAMRKCFELHKYPKDTENNEVYEGMVLVGVRGRLYEVDALLSVSRSASGFGAVGSGEQPALGVLFATEGQKPKARVLKALEISAKVCNTVSPPFHIVSTE